MATQPRKLRERQAREELILDHAHILLNERGYHSLNLEELAQRVEYSKGTIYQHFTTKEDLLLGIVLRSGRRRLELFQAAARYPGFSRAKITAIGIADLLLYEEDPGSFLHHQFCMTHSVWEKTSPARQEEMHRVFEDIMFTCMGILQSARLAGDILDPEVKLEDIVMGLMTMSKGAILIASDEGAIPAQIVQMTMSCLQRNRQRFCDGVQWKPLYADYDYPALEQSLREVYFAPYTKTSSAHAH